MPESVTDRCTKSHEYIFLFSKKPKYYFDHEAIQEPASFSTYQLVEDVKGVKTQEYKLKKKMMQYIYGIDIKEV